MLWAGDLAKGESHLCLRQGKGEEDYSDETAAGIQVPGAVSLKEVVNFAEVILCLILRPHVLKQIEEGLRHDEVQRPVEAGRETDTLTAEPERINLHRLRQS